jgi:hypothetical protein
MSDEPAQRLSLTSRDDVVSFAHKLLSTLDAASGRDITLVDVDFSPWPLDDAAVIDALTRWIRLPGRRLHLVATRYDVVTRDQPRFAAWRQPFAHAVDSWTPVEIDATDLPSMLLLDGGCLELFDRERWHARWTAERRSCILQRERIDALMQRCEAAWPVTMLGL